MSKVEEFGRLGLVPSETWPVKGLKRYLQVIMILMMRYDAIEDDDHYGLNDDTDDDHDDLDDDDHDHQHHYQIDRSDNRLSVLVIMIFIVIVMTIVIIIVSIMFIIIIIIIVKLIEVIEGCGQHASLPTVCNSAASHKSSSSTAAPSSTRGVYLFRKPNFQLSHFLA